MYEQVKMVQSIYSVHEFPTEMDWENAYFEYLESIAPKWCDVLCLDTETGHSKFMSIPVFESVVDDNELFDAIVPPTGYEIYNFVGVADDNHVYFWNQITWEQDYYNYERIG